MLLDKNKYGQYSIGADLTALAKSVGWRYQSTIIWHKQNIFRRTAWGSWRSASAPYVIAPVELIIVLYKGAWKKTHRGISDVARDESHGQTACGLSLEKIPGKLVILLLFQGNFPNGVSSCFHLWEILYLIPSPAAERPSLKPFLTIDILMA